MVRKNLSKPSKKVVCSNIFREFNQVSCEVNHMCNGSIQVARIFFHSRIDKDVCKFTTVNVKVYVTDGPLKITL